MSQYKTGTVAVTNASAAIVGTGTLWASTVAAGQTFIIQGSTVPYVIGVVTDDTHITLTAAYAGSTQSGLSYEINTSRTPVLLLDYPEQGDIDTATTLKNMLLKLEAILSGSGYNRLSKSVAGSANVTLTTVENGNGIMEFTGVLTGSINVIVSTNTRPFLVYNATTGAYTLTVKTASGTGVVVPQGYRALLECDGTNVVSAISAIAALAIAGNATVGGTLGVTGALTASGLVDLSGASAGQIKFPATQNPSSDANTLDDYEEGTYTPAMWFQGTGSATYTTRTGRYVKIGRLVNACFYINTASYTAGTVDNLGITLPFAGINDGNGYCLGAMSITGWVPTTKAPVLRAAVNSANALLMDSIGGGNQSNNLSGAAQQMWGNVVYDT